MGKGRHDVDLFNFNMDLALYNNGVVVVVLLLYESRVFFSLTMDGAC